MSDVNVNIRGRDEGLGAQLDALREKAQSLGKEVTNLNKMSDLTPTQQRMAVDKVGQSTLRAQQDQVKTEHSNLRESNVKEFRADEKKYQAGEMSKADFEKSQKNFQEAQNESLSSEEKELSAIQKEMTLQLRLIHREMMDARKITRERAQRDNKEFGGAASGGILGGLAAENRQLQKEKLAAKSADEVQELEERIQSNKERMKEMEGGGRNKGDGEGLSSGEVTALGTAMANANFAATGQGALQGGGKVLGMGKAGATAAGIFAMAYGLLNQSSQLYEGGGKVGAMRGTGYDSATTMHGRVDEVTQGLGGSGYEYGLTPVQVLEMMEGKGKRTGKAGDDLQRRSLDDLTFQRAFGEDVSQFDQFERFTKGQDEAAGIALDVLNVLTSIEDSSLKEGDLATLGEKLATQTTLMSIQRSKRDLVDTDSSLRMMAAWESIGLSQKGEKAGDFLSNTIRGLGEGGSDNEMLLKYEAAKQAHPELANDPAALRRFVRFNNDDPEYMNTYMQMVGNMTGGNNMAFDQLMYSQFNPESEYDMNLYERAAGGEGDFAAYATGQKGIQKGRKGTLSQEYARQEAGQMVGGLDQLVTGFKEAVGDFGKMVEDFFSNNSVDVNVINKQGKLPIKRTTPKTGG